MTVCLAGLALLYVALGETRGSLLMVMGALGVFGIGQGLFTAANNTAIMAAAPEDLSGEAGGLLNVTRAFGISLGIASASTVLAWRLAAMGVPGRAHGRRRTGPHAGREPRGGGVPGAICDRRGAGLRDAQSRPDCRSVLENDGDGAEARLGEHVRRDTDRLRLLGAPRSAGR